MIVSSNVGHADGGAVSGSALLGNLLTQKIGTLSSLSQGNGGLGSLSGSLGGVSGGSSGGGNSGSDSHSGNNGGANAGAGINLGAFANLAGVGLQ